MVSPAEFEHDHYRHNPAPTAVEAALPSLHQTHGGTVCSTALTLQEGSGVRVTERQDEFTRAFTRTGARHVWQTTNDRIVALIGKSNGRAWLRMSDLITDLFDQAGQRVAPDTVLIRGASGLRALARSARVSSDAPERVALAVTHRAFRSSSVTLIQAWGSSVTLRVCERQLSQAHVVLAGKTGEAGTFDPGAMRATWMFDGSQGFDWELGAETASLVVSVPRGALSDYMELLRGAPLLIHEPTCSVTHAVAGFALGLVNEGGGTQTPTFTPIAQYAVDRFLQEMVGIILVEDRGATGVHSGSRQRLYLGALAVVAESYADPGLALADVAKTLSASVRALQLAFQEAGTTFSAELRAQRARAAHALLLSPEYDVLSIGEIAARCGYHSPATLRDEVKARFGATPRRLRGERS